MCVSICVLFQSISVLFVFRFWHFMQPLGVNMLIRAMYNTLSPLRETQNVFEMLINASDPRQIGKHSRDLIHIYGN